MSKHHDDDYQINDDHCSLANCVQLKSFRRKLIETIKILLENKIWDENDSIKLIETFVELFFQDKMVIKFLVQVPSIIQLILEINHDNYSNHVHLVSDRNEPLQVTW